MIPYAITSDYIRIAPVLVTTTEYVQPAPGINGAHTIVNTVPVMASAQAMGHTGRGMVQHTHYQERNNQYEGHLPTGGASYPMPTGGVSYPMPQPQNLQGIPMPPGQQQTAGAYPIPCEWFSLFNAFHSSVFHANIMLNLACIREARQSAVIRSSGCQ